MRPYATPLEVEAPCLAERLRAEMKGAGVSIRGLAEQSGVDKETISRWRRGLQSRVRVEAVAKVATELGTTVDDLLCLPPVPAREPRPAPSRPDHGDLLRQVADLEDDVVPRLNRLAAEARRVRGD